MGLRAYRDLPAEDTDHGSAEKEVDDDDEDGGDDDGLGGGASDALSSALGVHAEVAANAGDDESEEEWFGESLDDVCVVEGSVGVVEVGGWVEAEEGDADHGSTGDTDGVGEDGEEEEHEDGCDEARGDQFADGVGAEGSHGVNLLGDLHGADLGGHSGGVSAGDHEAGQDGAEFLDHGECDEIAGHADGAKLLQGGGGLEGKNAAGEESGEDDDRQGTEADVIHLGVDVGPVARLGEEIGEGVSREDGVILDGGNLLLCEYLWGDEGHVVIRLNVSDARERAKIA